MYHWHKPKEKAQALAASFAMLLSLMLACGLAVAEESGVKQLPKSLYNLHGNQPASVEGKDFRLHRTHAKDINGKDIGDVSAWLVDVSDAYPGTKKFDPMYGQRIPPFNIVIPDALRGEIALYYFYGWKIVPRDWQIRYAFISVDGSDGLSAVSPEGAQQGWIDFSWFNACLGCMDKTADGLILGAHEAYKNDMEIDDMPLAEPRLLPKPSTLVHPNKCSVLFSYQPDRSLPIEAAMSTQWSGRTLSFVGGVYAAFPREKKALADFIVRQYLSDQPRCVR